MAWRTPPAAGHYCLQVELVWPDDAEPGNNLGQHNTDVKALNSPHAMFRFPARNDGAAARLLRLVADAYEIPPLQPCRPERRGHDAGPRRRELLARHNRAAWPVPEGWDVAVEPAEARLGPGESIEVTVDITAPDGYRGRQVVNVHGFDGPDLVGGVTLYAEGSG